MIPSTNHDDNVRIANCTVDECGGTQPVPLAMPQIIQSIDNATSGWPRRIGDALFVDDRGVSWLPNTDALFGWLGSATGRPPLFRKGSDCHSPGQVFQELKRTVRSYIALEMLPHEPAREGHYYAGSTPSPGDGQALRQLVARYSPETDIDGDLIAAMFATVFWGGDSGTRPAFLITSDAGRGTGKTTLASHVAYLAGGPIDLSPNEDMGVLKQRLLSPEGMMKRVAILDNVKSLRFSWAELEALITSPSISGKRLYVGEGHRPNNLVWLITLNGASLAKDLAQRCVIIKLAKPERSGTWAEETRGYIDEHRAEIVADCIALLREPRHVLTTYSRWAAWERNVLERLPEPADAQATILERQQVADVENEEAGLIQEHFARRLKNLNYDPDRDRVFIPSEIVCDWHCQATREKQSSTAVSKKLIQAIDEKSITLLVRNTCNTWGRGFVWCGPLFATDAAVKTDIECRIQSSMWER